VGAEISKEDLRRLKLKALSPRTAKGGEMNPCIDCTFDKQGCHESGFAADKCPYWATWVTELAIFKAECKARTRETRRHLESSHGKDEK